MLPLTREYALTKLAAYPDFEKEARERWLNWYLDFAKKNGGIAWADWYLLFDKLQNEWGNLLAVLHWCVAQERYTDIQKFWQHLHDFALLYGYWEESQFLLEWLIQESHRRGDLAIAAYAMSEKSWTLILQNKLDEAEQLLSKTWDLRNHVNLRRQTYLACYQAVLHIRKKEYEKAFYWLNIEEELVNSINNLNEKEYTQYLIPILDNRASIYYHTNNYEQAKILYQSVVELATRINWQRFTLYAQRGLADIAIIQGDFVEAEELLKIGLIVAERNNEKRRTSYYQSSFARLEKAQGNIDKCREWATKALNGFHRLGMAHNIEEMCSLINSLEIAD